MSDDDDNNKLDADTQEAWDYLLEVVQDYERYLSDIGNLGMLAPNLLYYRSEVQDMLDDFKTNRKVDFRGIWMKVRALDEILRTRQQEVVDEIGHANFLQYQIINDPSRAHWWWWLNRVTKAPPPPPPWWQFWKKDHLAAPPPAQGAAPAEGEAEAFTPPEEKPSNPS